MTNTQYVHVTAVFTIGGIQKTMDLPTLADVTALVAGKTAGSITALTVTVTNGIGTIAVIVY
jgi:hypothetical protein